MAEWSSITRLAFIALIIAMLVIMAIGAWSFIEAAFIAAVIYPDSATQICLVVVVILFLVGMSFFNKVQRGQR